MRRYGYSRPDGGVRIRVLAEQAVDELMAGGMSEEDAVRHLLAQNVPDGFGEPVPVDSLPDRASRNEWKLKDGKVSRVARDVG